MKIFAESLTIIGKSLKRILMHLFKFKFKKIGNNVIFDPFDHFSYRTIEIHDEVFIGSGAKFSASESSIKIKSKVMFGPNVTIMGGDHRTDVVGKYMFDVKEKLPENDLDVVISEDVWIGCNVVILKGVHIGKGAIIAAGSLVNKNVESYSIVAGLPAKKISDRFTKDEIAEHEQMLLKK